MGATLFSRKHFVGSFGARAAQNYGSRVLILEAQAYIGGRNFTDNTTFSEIGFDLGAQSFQQVISGNELLAGACSMHRF